MVNKLMTSLSPCTVSAKVGHPDESGIAGNLHWRAASLPQSESCALSGGHAHTRSILPHRHGRWDHQGQGKKEEQKENMLERGSALWTLWVRVQRRIIRLHR